MTILVICKRCGHIKQNHSGFSAECRAIIDYPVDTDFYLGFNHCDCPMFQ